MGTDRLQPGKVLEFSAPPGGWPPTGRGPNRSDLRRRPEILKPAPIGHFVEFSLRAVFPSKRSTPMRYDNYLKRVLKPAAEASGIEAITHQMLRRSFSTMALDSGASPKDVQGQMRHTEARMSLYYGKVIPASVKKEVNKLVDQIKKKIDEQGKKSEQAEAKTGRNR